MKSRVFISHSSSNDIDEFTRKLAELLKRSGDEPRWIWRPLNPKVVLTSAVTDGARFTLVILTCLADEHGSVALQTKDLASALGCVDRALQRHYRELEQAKFLRVERDHPLTRFRVDFGRVVAAQDPASPAIGSALGTGSEPRIRSACHELV